MVSKLFSKQSEEDEEARLTDEQIAREEEFLKGIPRINLAALLVPPIWGPGHGIWVTVLWYPIWLFADNVFYAAYSQQTTLSFVVAAIVGICLLALTVFFAIVSQPFAAHRAAEQGRTKEEYLKRERIWAVICAVVGIAFIAFATYYNLAIRS